MWAWMQIVCKHDLRLWADFVGVDSRSELTYTFMLNLNLQLTNVGLVGHYQNTLITSPKICLSLGFKNWMAIRCFLSAKGCHI